MVATTLDDAPTTHIADCACEPCLARYRQRKLYRLDYERGKRRMTDAGRARAHLLWLAEQGAGRRTVAKALGISELTLVHIGNGRRTRIKVATEIAILGFQPDQADLVANCATVDATATRLRVEALIALGYTKAFIAHRLGRSQGDLDINERVYRRRALGVLELCREIGDAPGPSKKAAVQARNKGWRVPATYDEDLFYDPHWDGTEPEAECESRAVQNLAECEFLTSCGLEIEQIAVGLGVSVRYLLVLRRRECTPEQLAVKSFE